MFNCENSYVQTYNCQVMYKPPFKDKPISFDVCLGAELMQLWNLGIETIGCCCGKHCNIQGENLSYIQVDEQYIDRMLELGYCYRYNNMLDVQNCFIPETKFT